MTKLDEIYEKCWKWESDDNANENHRDFIVAFSTALVESLKGEIKKMFVDDDVFVEEFGRFLDEAFSALRKEEGK